MLQKSQRQVFAVLHQLDEGIINHTAWLKLLHRTLICGGEHEHPTDLQDNAHECCAFGRWYYSVTDTALKKNPLFMNIAKLHKEMHDAARHALQKRSRSHDLNTAEYDSFIDRAIDFKMEVRNLQLQLMEEICAVDHLTGAWNRHTMHFKLAEEHERVARGGARCCLCMVDLDHFKDINDTYGHIVGDKVLQQVTRFISDNLRKYDSIYRYGGEEFLLCLPETNVADAKDFLERLSSKMAGYVIDTGNGQTLRVTASFGLTSVSKDKNIDDIIAQADHALLCAKAEGRNRVCVWDRLDYE